MADTKKIEMRTFEASLRATSPDDDDDDDLEIEGRAASYNILSADLGNFREQLAPGCFSRALREGQDVRCLFNHSADNILGRVASGTLKLEDSPQGLRFRCKLDPAIQAHRDLHASIKRGDIDGCSFSFMVPDGGDEWDKSTDERGKSFTRRTVKDVNLFDVGPVTFPAYSAKGATSVAARFDYRLTTGPQGEPLLTTPDPWAEQRAELQRLDDKLADDLNRIRVQRIGEEIARGK